MFGKRSRMVSCRSWMTAPVGEVIRATTRGRKGSGRLQLTYQATPAAVSRGSAYRAIQRAHAINPGALRPDLVIRRHGDQPNRWLLIEVSPDRSRTVATILRRAGYRDVRSTKGGLEVTRVLTARA